MFSPHLLSWIERTVHLLRSLPWDNVHEPSSLDSIAIRTRSVCFVCSVKKTYLVIGLIWVMSWLAALPDVFVALGTEPLGFFLSRVFCVGDRRVFRNPLLKEKRDAS
ncbi:unnamed protein product [Gadus morhua 'NCC']